MGSTEGSWDQGQHGVQPFLGGDHGELTSGLVQVVVVGATAVLLGTKANLRTWAKVRAPFSWTSQQGEVGSRGSNRCWAAARSGGGREDEEKMYLEGLPDVTS